MLALVAANLVPLVCVMVFDWEVFPLMLFLMATILMVQLMSFQRLFLVLLTAPLALIGVAGALLISRAPMGFVAILGVISLIGMILLAASAVQLRRLGRRG